MIPDAHCLDGLDPPSCKTIVNFSADFEQRSDLPRASIKFPTFVDAEEQEDVLARPKSLVKNTLVVSLSRPKSPVQTRIQILLEKKMVSKEAVSAEANSRT
jgi:hypothetical protein